MSGTSASDHDNLLRRYEREHRARLEAEAILASKSHELYERNEELSALTRQLEQQVEERTRALEEARDQALQAARAKSEFIANMSHEIRTPLNGVLGILGMLAGTELDEAQQRLVATASDSGHHLLGIINDILDFSKIESGKMTLEKAPVNLEEQVRQSVDALQVVARNKGLTLSVDIAEGFPALITGDALRLRQIILNLLSNAIKFTGSGGVAVGLHHEQSCYRLEIQDSGIGMSAEQCGLIFNAFDQADSSITRRFGGTGLGLAITQRLVALMKGRIEVTSKEGQGSCFSVRLPLRLPDARTVRTGLAAGWNPASFRGRRILLVEDNEVNQLIARHLLEKLGLEVVCAGNGQEALNQTGQMSFDCILMDLQMPVMDGLEATRRLRERGGVWQTIPIIAMTAHASEEHRLESIDSGMNEHLTKPIVVTSLQATLARFLGGSGITLVEPEPEPGALPPSVLDVSRAMARLAGNRLLYSELLAAFVREHEQDADRIVRSLHSGDRQSALVRLHSLAGSAANLGATALAAVAHTLEHQLESDPVADPQHLRLILERSWQQLLAQIENDDGTLSYQHACPCETQTDTDDERPTLDESRLLHHCEEMSSWLHEDLVQVDEVLSELLLAQLPARWLDRLSQLQQLLNQFCIEDAEALLQQLIAGLRGGDHE